MSDAVQVRQAADARLLDVLGGQVTVLLAGEDTAGSYALFDLEVPPGNGPPPHIHRREDETFVVLRGQVEFLAGSSRVVVGPTTAVHAPRDIPHTYRNVGDEPARLLVTARPAGIEAMFARLDELGRQGAVGPADVIAACQAAGIELLLDQ